MPFPSADRYTLRSPFYAEEGTTRPWLIILLFLLNLHPCIVHANPMSLTSPQENRLIIEAASLHAGRNYPSALAKLQIIEASDPNHPVMLISMGDIYMSMCDFEKALRYYHRLQEQKYITTESVAGYQRKVPDRIKEAERRKLSAASDAGCVPAAPAVGGDTSAGKRDTSLARPTEERLTSSRTAGTARIVNATAASPTPIWKRGGFWGGLLGGSVAAALAVTLGVALGSRGSSTPTGSDYERALAFPTPWKSE